MSKVGILVLLYDDLQHVSVILKSLGNQTYNGKNITKISGEQLNNVIILPDTENIGFAQGNNLLAERAIMDGCDYLWVLNPDMEPDPESLEKLIDFIEVTPEAGMAGPILLKGDSIGNPTIQLFGSEANYRTQAKKALYVGRSLSDVSLP